jgi:hypothetical protein
MRTRCGFDDLCQNLNAAIISERNYHIGNCRNCSNPVCATNHGLAKPTTEFAFFASHGPEACAERTGAAARAAHRRRVHFARAGQGMQACQNDTQAAQAFEPTHTKYAHSENILSLTAHTMAHYKHAVHYTAPLTYSNTCIQLLQH